MGRQKTKLQYVALLFRLWVDTLPSPLKLGASRLRCFRLRPDVCAKTFSHDYIARLKAGSEISVHKQLISQLSPAIESKSVFISERGWCCTTFTRSHHPALWYITWDPTQNIATRPLAIQKDATWYTYGWDLTKNICEVFGPAGYLRAAYTYTPYGQVTANGDVEQPIQWSSEAYDAELSLVYYNYRYYNPELGRWTKRDPIEEDGGVNMYSVLHNNMCDFFDLLGLDEHHIIPKSLWKKHFPTSMRSWLNKQVVHATSHNFTRHGVYNAVVRNEIMKLYPNGIRNQAEAQRVLMVITKECKFTKIFNKKAKKGPKAVAAWFDKYGYKYVPVELQEKATRALRYSKISQGIKKSQEVLQKKFFWDLLSITLQLWLWKELKTKILQPIYITI